MTEPASKSRTPRPVDSVVVVSADRPALLARCLEALTAHFGTCDRAPRVIVVDGSRKDPSTTWAAVQSFHARGAARLEYIGDDEAATLRDAIAAEGVPGRVLQWGVTPGDIGSNRNLATLATAGERVLMVDDDVLCEPREPGGSAEGVTIAGHADLREWHFHGTRAEAVAAASPSNVDLLAEHGGLLGASLADVLTRSPRIPNLDHACGHMQAMLGDGTRPVVRVTFAGVVGDSACYCPSRLLLLQGDTRRQLMQSASTFRLALTSREVRRMAPETIVTHDPACMAYCMGLENGRLVPPFMPAGRNEDSVFGAMLALADPFALFAHLPHGVVHDSTRPSLYPIGERTRSAQQTRISELLLLELAALARSSPDGMVPDRLEWIGQHLVTLGETSPREFADRVTQSTVNDRRRDLAVMATPPLDAALPDYWRSAVEGYRSTLQESVKHPAFFVPIECQSAESGPDRFARTQAFLRAFGEFLLWWPRIWTAAKALNERVRQT